MRKPNRAFSNGQSLAEYGLVLALVAIVSIAGLTSLGGSVQTMFQDVAASLASAAPAGDVNISENGCQNCQNY